MRLEKYYNDTKFFEAQNLDIGKVLDLIDPGHIREVKALGQTGVLTIDDKTYIMFGDDRDVARVIQLVQHYYWINFNKGI